jgi:3-oxoacyl-[acyl-carrier-protein] synthase II
LGSGGGAQDFSEENYRLYFNGKAKQASIFSIPSGTMGTMSSEISMRFGLRGMSHVITTGCTSSTDAFGYALRQIQFGFIPAMLVGGVDAPIAPGIMKGFALMRIMTSSWNHAPERASRPFSADRDGFVLAEGAWMFVLEEYEHSRARGANILAEVAGYGSTCEAYHRVRLQECGEEPARAIQMAMDDAGIAASDVNYVNLHGTSTQLNDRIETQALKLALGKTAKSTPMSSLKSQIGHPQGASGAAGIAATLVAMTHEQIPPTTNLETAAPECDLAYFPEAGGVQLHRLRIEELGVGAAQGELKSAASSRMLDNRPNSIPILSLRLQTCRRLNPCSLWASSYPPPRPTRFTSCSMHPCPPTGVSRLRPGAACGTCSRHSP